MGQEFPIKIYYCGNGSVDTQFAWLKQCWVYNSSDCVCLVVGLESLGICDKLYTHQASTAQIAGYAYIIPPGLNQTVDGQYVRDSEDGHVVMVNGTLIRILLKKPFRDSELNELLYVIIVIVFYATALMTLIITQIKRQRREGSDADYYDEYLQRNQEVKRTCQTATTLVRKSEKSVSTISPMTASTSTSVPDRGSSISLLEPPSRARDQSPRSAPRHGSSSHGFGRGGCSVGGSSKIGGGDEISFHTLSSSPHEISPMLESIPDIGT